MHAEDAYLFRHALLRDAAYEMQPVSVRAQGHAQAANIIADVTSSAPDASATEIVDHLRLARVHFDAPSLLEMQLKFSVMAAKYARKTYRNSEAIDLWLETAELVGGRERSRALANAGDVASDAGLTLRAADIFRAALALSESAQDQLVEADVLVGLANTYRTSGRPDEAEALYRRARTTYAGVGGPVQLGKLSTNLANLYLDTGRVDEAEREFLNSLKLFRRSNDAVQEARALISLGTLALETGQLGSAKDYYLRASDQAKQLGDVRGEGVALSGLATYYISAREFEAAIEALDSGAHCARVAGDRIGEGIMQGNRAVLLTSQDRFDEALECHELALSIHRETNNRRSEGISLGNVGVLHLRTGRLREARHQLEAALKVHREIRNVAGEGSHLCFFAMLELEEGNVAEAERKWTRGAYLLAKQRNSRELLDQADDMRIACAKAGIEPFDVPEEPKHDDH